MLTEQPILITSIVAGEAIPKNRFIDFSGSLESEGNKPLGVSNADTNINNMLPVCVQGIALVLTSAAIVKGTAVQSMSDGYAGPQSTGIIAGYAMDEATGADQLIRVLLS